MLKFTDELDHVCMVLSGYESYLSGGNKDVTYTKSVLRLNGVNLPDVAGTESFASAIKEGGKKMFDMVMALLKRIKDFFFGIFGGKKAAAVAAAPAEIKSDLTEIKKAEIKQMAKDDVQKIINKVKPAGTAIKATRVKLERLKTLMKEELSDFNSDHLDTMNAAGFNRESLIGTITDKLLQLGTKFAIVTGRMVLGASQDSIMKPVDEADPDSEKAFDVVIETLENMEALAKTIPAAREQAKGNLAFTTDLTAIAIKIMKEHEDDQKVQTAGAHVVTTLGKYNNLFSRIIIMLDDLSLKCLEATKGVKKAVTGEDTRSELEKFEEFMSSDEPLQL